MDVSKFTKPTGRLIQVDKPPRWVPPGVAATKALAHKPDKEWSFIPDEFGPRWDFDARLWPLLNDANKAVAELNGIGRSMNDPELLLVPLRRREAITSSKIEGTVVAPQQLLLYELDPKEAPKGNEEMADWQEVFNYSRALLRGCEMLTQEGFPICNRMIKEMHGILMQQVRGHDKSPGDFRAEYCQIGNRVARFVPAPGTEVQRLVANLEKYVNSEDPRYDPLVRAFLVHYQFETIHPFKDGNGRIGRALLALTIYQWLGHSLPWLYLSPYFEYYNDEYVERLFNVSARGEWSEWIEFCLLGTIAQARDSIRRCDEFKRLRVEFHGRVTSSGSARTHPIIECLFSTPVVTASAVANKQGVAFGTAQRDINRLIDAGILAPLANTYPQSYFAAEIIEVAHGEPQWDQQAKNATVIFTSPGDHSPTSALSLPDSQSPSVVLPTTWQLSPDHPSVPQGDPAQQRRGSSP